MYGSPARTPPERISRTAWANPWGLQGPALLPYLLSHPGNSVAALAAYWADATEALLAAEASDPGATFRVRYEDVAADPGRALAAIKDRLGLGDTNVPSTSAHGTGLPAAICPPCVRAPEARLSPGPQHHGPLIDLACTCRVPGFVFTQVRCHMLQPAVDPA